MMKTMTKRDGREIEDAVWQGGRSPAHPLPLAEHDASIAVATS